MEDIKNKDNLTAMVTYQEGFASGDIPKILSVLVSQSSPPLL